MGLVTLIVLPTCAFLFAYYLRLIYIQPELQLRPPKRDKLGRVNICLRNRILISTPEECLQILRGDGVGKRTNRLRVLESRSIPNQRLITAFGINNSFTTDDEANCKAFRHDAASLLRKANKNWPSIRDAALYIMCEESEGGKVVLFECAQVLALKLAMYVLFGADPLLLDRGKIMCLAKGINDGWQRSKEEGEYVKEQSAAKLEGLVRDLIPEQNLVEATNPLNLILPAYETVWRVALRCFLEVGYRHAGSPNAEKWQRALKCFFQDPTTQTFETTLNDFPVSAKFIADEALRLYPPTRRVHRYFEFSDSSNNEEVIKVNGFNRGLYAADLEVCHRNTAVFGEKPLEFNPARWVGVDENVRRKNFMPFGAGKFTCPAQPSFGGMMVALLVTAMLTSLGNNEGLLEREDKVLEREIQLEPLDTGRDSLKEVKAVRGDKGKWKISGPM